MYDQGSFNSLPNFNPGLTTQIFCTNWYVVTVKISVFFCSANFIIIQFITSSRYKPFGHFVETIRELRYFYAFALISFLLILHAQFNNPLVEGSSWGMLNWHVLLWRFTISLLIWLGAEQWLAAKLQSKLIRQPIRVARCNQRAGEDRRPHRYQRLDLSITVQSGIEANTGSRYGMLVTLCHWFN